jgi:hypothetical protein
MLAANAFVDAAYKFKAATWWIWLLVALIGWSGLLVSGLTAFSVFLVLWKSGMLAGVSDVVKGLVWPALWLLAVFAYAGAYRLTIQHRIVRILDKGIAVGLH